MTDEGGIILCRGTKKFTSKPSAKPALARKVKARKASHGNNDAVSESVGSLEVQAATCRCDGDLVDEGAEHRLTSSGRTAAWTCGRLLAAIESPSRESVVLMRQCASHRRWRKTS